MKTKEEILKDPDSKSMLEVLLDIRDSLPHNTGESENREITCPIHPTSAPFDRFSGRCEWCYKQMHPGVSPSPREEWEKSAQKYVEKEIDGYINRQFVLGHFKQFIPTLLSQAISDEKARIRGKVENMENADLTHKYTDEILWKTDVLNLLK